jgi:hypothetical protein
LPARGLDAYLRSILNGFPRSVRMSNFEERERAYETKFARDLEASFLARTRAHYQAGLWAAGLMGKSDAEAEAYAEAVRIEDFHGKGARAAAAKIEADLEGRVSGAEIDAKIAELRAQAERDLRGTKA